MEFDVFTILSLQDEFNSLGPRSLIIHNEIVQLKIYCMGTFFLFARLLKSLMHSLTSILVGKGQNVISTNFEALPKCEFDVK